MPHATHFLRQLERTNPEQCDLALRLYHHPRIVHYVLEHVGIPAGKDRLAISVDPGDEGPYVVVGADGGFVTCLGQGMTTDDLPVVTYSRLQNLLSKIEDFRERVQMAREMTGEGQLHKLLRRVWKSADRLSREEFLATSALQPILKFDFLISAVSNDEAVQATWPALLKIRRIKKRNIPKLRSYWASVWSTGHMLALFALNGARGMEDILEQAFDEPITLSMTATCHGQWATAMRGIWAVGRP